MKPIFNRAPLTPNNLSPLPLGSIRPDGWLREEMEMQKDGITAQFEAVCPEFASGKWICGEDGDCTRSIYYLEGLIALGWTLNDEALKAKANAFIESILSSQREDGWFGPADNTDYWPLMLALRALRLWFTASADKRVLKLMDRFFKYEYAHLADNPMREWAVARGGENMESALWLYNLTGQEYLLKLCRKLQAQTLDWPNYFHTFANVMPMNKAQRWERMCEGMNEEGDDGLTGEKRPYFHNQFHTTEGVNLAIGLKTPGVINQFKSGFKEKDGFHFGWEKLMRSHGTACGMYTCDDHLNGSSPIQGIRLNAVVEMLNSMETLLGISEFNQECADVLEKIAYNALPAAFNADMTAYQPLQQVNQVKLSDETRKWYNRRSDANLFRGARNDVDCAAAHQAWGKLTASLWYATDDNGIAAVSYAPCTVRAAIDGNPVRVRVSGGYPFMQNVKFEISLKQSAEFPMYLRIPFWARQAMIYLPDGEIMSVRSNEYACVRRKWQNGDVLRLELPASPRITRWYHQSGSVEVGPLVMALDAKADWTETENGLIAAAGEEWNRALVRDEPMKLIQVEEDVSAYGKGESSVSVMIRTAAVEWGISNGSCGSLPMAPQFKREALDILELIPYGEADLRITEFPYGSIKEEKQKEIK